MHKAAELLQKYLDASISGDPEGALSCFSEDIYFSHRALQKDGPDAPRYELRGRAEVRKFLEHASSNAPIIMRIQTCFAEGRHALIRCDALDSNTQAPMVSFVNEVVLDPNDDLFNYFASFAASSAVASPEL
jgi:ketosteroid isomerase-like protein